MPQWTIEIDEDTARAVRSHLGQSPDTQLSEFVTSALRRALFWKAVDASRELNRDVDPTDLQAAVDSALDDVRARRP